MHHKGHPEAVVVGVGRCVCLQGPVLRLPPTATEGSVGRVLHSSGHSHVRRLCRVGGSWGGLSGTARIWVAGLLPALLVLGG